MRRCSEMSISYGAGSPNGREPVPVESSCLIPRLAQVKVMVGVYLGSLMSASYACLLASRYSPLVPGAFPWSSLRSMSLPQHTPAFQCHLQELSRFAVLPFIHYLCHPERVLLQMK